MYLKIFNEAQRPFHLKKIPLNITGIESTLNNLEYSSISSIVYEYFPFLIIDISTRWFLEFYCIVCFIDYPENIQNKKPIFI